MDRYFILMSMLGLVMLSTTILVTVMLIRNKKKNTNIEAFATRQKQSEFDQHIEYVGCTGLDRINPKKPEATDTIEMLARAPCWVYATSGKTRDEVLTSTVPVIKDLYSKNNAAGSVVGPAYIIMGRNVNTASVDAWLYMPSIGKDGIVLPDKESIIAHQWLKGLLFTTTYGVSDWLCNNSCDTTYVPVKAPVSVYSMPIIPEITPECGCISDKSCHFNAPSGVSVPKRKISSLNTYSIYRLKKSFFASINVPFTGSEYINSSILPNGSKMYQGCSSRLVSDNRQYAFEVTANGASIYEARSGSKFVEGCIAKPGERTFVDIPKVEKDTYATPGKLPQVINDGETISISSINVNRRTRKKELVPKWKADIGKESPYMLMMDNDGGLKLLDKKGEVSDALFSQA